MWKRKGPPALVHERPRRIPTELAHTLDDLPVVKPDENVSALQRIKANPNKPSADAMLALLKKLATIEATGPPARKSRPPGSGERLAEGICARPAQDRFGRDADDNLHRRPLRITLPGATQVEVQEWAYPL